MPSSRTLSPFPLEIDPERQLPLLPWSDGLASDGIGSRRNANSRRTELRGCAKMPDPGIGRCCRLSCDVLRDPEGRENISCWRSCRLSPCHPICGDVVVMSLRSARLWHMRSSYGGRTADRTGFVWCAQVALALANPFVVSLWVPPIGYIAYDFGDAMIDCGKSRTAARKIKS